MADSPPATVDVCPYQGLTPFETTDAKWFFGRERLVAELVTYLSSQLTPPSMLAVVGSSGSGKSSLLRAGLLPALADGLLPVARDWPKVVVTPGARPLVALSTAVACAQIPGAPTPEPDDLVDAHRLRTHIRRAFGPTPGRRMALVVDQLEPGLMDVLLADIGVGPASARPEPGFLPLLSHALLATWRREEWVELLPGEPYRATCAG